MSVKRTVLQTLPIPELPGWESRLVPGLAAPLHSHPVSATGFVLEGKVVSQWEGRAEVEEYGAGESFIDHGEIMHLRSENVSTDKPLRMLCS